jgi:Tfp pilus assembly protein PilV
MLARSPLPRSRLLHLDEGFYLVEALMAAFVLAVGVLALVGSFDSARKLSLIAERRTSMAHRAQLEIERLQTYPYGQLAMSSTPTHSSNKNNPDYYVNYSSPLKCATANCYAWNAESTGEEEALVTLASGKECASRSDPSECGWAASAPAGRACATQVGACEWTDGFLSGNVYDFVTWHNDKNCGAKCPAEKNYKRLTVVVTVNVPSGNHESTPVRVSTLVAEPH